MTMNKRLDTANEFTQKPRQFVFNGYEVDPIKERDPEWYNQLLEITQSLPNKLAKNIIQMNEMCWEMMDHTVLYEATFLLIEEYQSGNMDNCVYEDA